MKTATLKVNRFNRLFLLAIISSVCILLTQNVFADRYYGGRHRYCPRGYHQVFIPKHWRHGYLVHGKYVCTPNRSRHGYHYYNDRYRRDW